MSGLVYSAMGRAFSDIGTTIGGAMMRASDEEERERLRREEREARAAEREQARAESERLRIEMQARDHELRRELAGQRSSRSADGGGGGGGLSAQEIGQGGAAEGMIAGEMGLTVPELRALRGLRDGGDVSPFRRDTVTGGTTTEDPMLAGEQGETSDAISRRFAKRELEIRQELPPGFEREARSKIQALSRIEMAFRMGKDNKSYQDGESERFSRTNAEAARDGSMTVGRAGELSAALEGRPIFTVKGDERLNQFTGQSETTDVGESKVRRNDRPPAPRAAGGDGAGAGQPADDIKRLTQVRIAATSELGAAERALVQFDRAARDMSRSERAAAEPERQKILQRIESAQTQLSDVMSKLSGQGRPAASTAPAQPAPARQAPPDISKVRGVPAGAVVGSMVPGRGWEVRDSSGRLLGYIGN